MARQTRSEWRAAADARAAAFTAGLDEMERTIDGYEPVGDQAYVDARINDTSSHRHAFWIVLARRYASLATLNRQSARETTGDPGWYEKLAADQDRAADRMRERAAEVRIVAAGDVEEAQWIGGSRAN